MATQTRAPTSELDVSGTWTDTSTTRWPKVDDYPDSANPIADGITVGITGTANIEFGFSAFTIPAGSTAISVQVLYYDFKTASQACSIAAQLRIGSTPTNHDFGTTHNPGNGNANIAQRTNDFGTTNPKSGSAWTVDDVNGVGTNGLVGFGLVSADNNPSITISCIQLQVTYTPPAPAEDQDSYRFRNDDGSETTATWVAALNTDATLQAGYIYRARILVQNAGSGGDTDLALTWQYNRNAAGWNNVTTSSAVIKAVASANFVDGDDCTQQLGAGTFFSNNDGMTEDGTAGGVNLDLPAGQEAETELSFQIVYGDVARGDSIQLRLASMATYTRTPTITVLKPYTVPILPPGKPEWPLEINRNSRQARGLVNWWPMQPQGGTRLFDLMGTGRDGSLTNFSILDCWVRAGLLFDGVDSYVTANVQETLGNVTVAAWVKCNLASTNQNILNNGNDSVALRFFQTTGPSFALQTSTGYNVAEQSSALTTDQWYHLAGTWDGTLARLYVNGVQVASAGPFPGTPISSATWDIGIHGNLTSGPYNGLMADLRVYSRTLTAAEILALYAPPTRWELYGEEKAFAPTGAVTMAANAGAYALTGAAATLTKLASPTLPSQVFVNQAIIRAAYF